ncbi:MAG: hypothetical protein ACRCU0_01950 [Candidatus Rhabdochlamydia sp.]
MQKKTAFDFGICLELKMSSFKALTVSDLEKTWLFTSVKLKTRSKAFISCF